MTIRIIALLIASLSAVNPAWAAPGRIVTLTPALAEIVVAISADPARIVGVSEFTDEPASLRSRPRVSRHDRVGMEKLLELKPDLVIADRDANPEDSLRRIRELKIPTLTVSSGSLKEVSDSMRRIGSELGLAEAGEKAARAFESSIREIRARAESRKSAPRVFVQVGSSPLVTAGKDSLIQELLSLIGARNLYSDLRQAYPRPSVEDVLTRKPDHIVVLSAQPDSRRELEDWRRFREIPAVREGRVHLIEADRISRPGPRLPAGIAELESVVFGKVE